MPSLAPSRTRGLVSLTLFLTLANWAAAQEWRAAPPPAVRNNHALAFDSVRNRIVMFGGTSNGTVKGDTWEFDGTRWLYIATPNSPPPREGHAMVFDSNRNVVVLFGGTAAVPQNDTWEYDGTTWTRILTPSSPSVRNGHALSHDPVHGVVLFGGLNNNLSDTWTYDGVTWTQVITPTTPPGRGRHAMAFDSVRGVHVMFGGYGGGYRDDTWEFDGTAWIQVNTPAPPPARMGMGMTYDVGLGAVVMFGGFGSGTLSDTWHYNGSWTSASPPTSPPSRYGSPLTYDSARGRTLVFGGLGQTGLVDDTWEYDGTTWAEVNGSGRPAPRRATAIAFDALRQRTVLFGGLRFAGSWSSFADTWEFDGVDWSAITTPSMPPARSWHALTYDAARGRVVMYGGGMAVAGQWTNLFDTWEFDGTDWTQVVTNNAPTSSVVYSMAYDSRRRRHVVFGGLLITGSTTVFNDETWEYDGVDWTRVLTPTAPGARFGQGLAYDARRGVTVLFGGGGTNQHNDTWEYDGFTWTQVLTTSAPSARFLAGAMTYDLAQGRTLLFGGGSAGVTQNDTWDYDGVTWQQVQVPQAPPAALGSSLTYDVGRGTVIRFGGGNANSSYNTDETWELTPPSQPMWTGFGTGCPGSNGTPFLSAGTLPTLGANFVLNVSNLPGNAGLLFVANGLEFGRFGGQPLPLDLGGFGLPGCSLWIGPDPALSVGRSYINGTAAINTWIPNDTSFAGLRLGTQVLALDPSATAGGIALSNGGIGTIH